MSGVRADRVARDSRWALFVRGWGLFRGEVQHALAPRAWTAGSEIASSTWVTNAMPRLH